MYHNEMIQCIDMGHRIAVDRSGPAGLTFARVLHRQDHPFTAFERDPVPDACSPGGTLDLHEGMGRPKAARRPEIPR